MKLLFVLEHFHPYIGGAEQLFIQVTKALAKKGDSVTVITSRYKRSLPAKEVLEGVEIIRINCFNRYLFTFLSIPRILWEARQCDLIHTTTYNAAFPARLAGWFWHKPTIITFHEVWAKLWQELPFINRWQKWLYQNFERLILRMSFHRYIAVSKYTQRCLEQAGVPSHRIETIYNGLDYTTFPKKKHLPSSVFTYAYFGRLGISKGLDILLPAAKQFYAKHPESKLQLIIPRTPRAMFKQIQRLIQTLELENHIILYHDVPKQELIKILHHSSCVVIPSYSEGFCFAAAEAVALGVPIISSQRGALQEVVSGKYLPVEPLDVNTLYEALLKASQDTWEEIPVRRFPFEKTVEQCLNLYSNILKEE